jgi:hypothetical protein
MIPKSLLMKLIVLLIFIITSATANDFITSVLKEKRGDTLVFKGGGYKLLCSPHGVYTINDFLNDAEVIQDCKDALIKIYPNIKRRYESNLHRRLIIEQTYHIRSKDNRCVVYFNDNKTYPQVLVELGLGLVKKGFKSSDKWYEYRLNKAQKYAKREKNGVWSTPFLATCFEALK